MCMQVRYKGIDDNQNEVWASGSFQNGSPTVEFTLQIDGNAVMYVDSSAKWAANMKGLDFNTVGSPPHRLWIMNNGDFQIHRYDSSTGSWSTKWKYSDNDANNFAKSDYPTTLEEDGELCHPNYDKPSGSGSSCRPQWCISCPMGHIAVNMSVCVPCPQGTYLGDGSSECTRCDVGKYSNRSGSSECTGCAVGKYSQSRAATTCTTCPEGSISGENSTRAEDCLCNNVLRYFGPPGGTCVHECSQEVVRAAFFEEHADRVERLPEEVSLEFTSERERAYACVSACVPLRTCVREQNPYDMYTATKTRV